VRVVIDTCVWSRFLRRATPPSDSVAREVVRLVKADVVEMLGPIRQELLSGAQPDERFEQVRAYLRFFPNLRLDEEDDEIAAEYYNRCRRRGVQGSSTDLLICAASVRNGLKIFTTDVDFDFYAAHIPIKLHKIRS
jgi:predicted nucleic acid-binding protein